MGRFISNFDTTAEFAAFSATTAYSEPHVTLLKDNNEVRFIEYDPYVGHDYVEIGGLKWATMNVGANSVTDYGLYFQWGDVSGYTSSQVGTDKVFDWANYKYTNDGGSTMTKYNSTDGKTVLDLSDDAARANWGGAWRIPTTAEFQALGAVCSTAWTTTYEGSASGMLLTVTADTADNGKQLFFPAAGLCGDSSVYNVGSICNYWSSSLLTSNVQNAYLLLFLSNDVYWQYDTNRYYGFTVRPVVG